MDDKSLIDRIRSGDQTAFEELVRLHQRPLYGYMRARLPAHAEAEAATQEVFLRLAEDRHRLDPAQPILPWLLATADDLLREQTGPARRGEVPSW